MWANILELAGNDPLRAQEWEERLSESWWDRYNADVTARAKARKAHEEPDGE